MDSAGTVQSLLQSKTQGVQSEVLEDVGAAETLAVNRVADYITNGLIRIPFHSQNINSKLSKFSLSISPDIDRLIRLSQLQSTQRLKDELEQKLSHLSSQIQVLADIESPRKHWGKTGLALREEREKYYQLQRAKEREAAEYAAKMAEISRTGLRKQLLDAEHKQRAARELEEYRAEIERKEKAETLFAIREHEREKFQKMAEARKPYIQSLGRLPKKHPKLAKTAQSQSKSSLDMPEPEAQTPPETEEIQLSLNFCESPKPQPPAETPAMEPKTESTAKRWKGRYMKSVLEADRRRKEDEEEAKVAAWKRAEERKNYAKVVGELFRPKGKVTDSEEGLQTDDGKEKITFQDWLSRKNLSARVSPKSESPSRSLPFLSPQLTPRHNYLPTVRENRESLQSSVITHVQVTLQSSQSPSPTDLSSALQHFSRSERQFLHNSKLLKRVNLLHPHALDLQEQVDSQVLATMKSKLALLRGTNL